MQRISYIILLLLNSVLLFSQFAPAVGLAGSTAIHKDSSVFVAWATGCAVQRGYQDIAQPNLGYASVGDSTSAIGKAGVNGVVSLGDSGIATLTFVHPIYNGPGFDFAVFENGFPTGEIGRAFLEFAFVEVSSDGVNFVRFPAVSHIQDTAQLAMVGIDCSLVNNLAGKYMNGYGTPFDLEELRDKPNLNVNNITHIRVIDVVGSINNAYATFDIEGNKVNDPYPTAFPSGGFDLDAVGVIHSVMPNNIAEFQSSDFGLQISPNPAREFAICSLQFANENPKDVFVYDITGREIFYEQITSANCQLPTANWNKGTYFVKCNGAVVKLIVE